MTDLFQFTDFREYLRRYYDDRKKRNPRFSYQLLAQKAAIRNRGFIYNIIKGTHKVSKDHCRKLSLALNHTKKEARYFAAIVNFTQAKNEEERTEFLEEIRHIRTIENIPQSIISREHYEYLSKWYYSAIRSFIDLYPIRDNYELICEKIYPPVTVAEVKKSLALLERLGLIEKDEKGIFRVTGKSVKADKNLARIAMSRFHLECTELAKQAILHPPSKDFIVSSLTLGISEKTYAQLHEETIRFKNRVIELANADEHADRVYQYQLALFPLTSTGEQRRNP